MSFHRLLFPVIIVGVVGLVAVFVLIYDDRGGKPITAAGNQHPDESPFIIDPIDGIEQDKIETISPENKPETTEKERMLAEWSEARLSPLSGRVVEDSTDLPIKGAKIKIFSVRRIERDDEGKTNRILSNFHQKAVSDALGEFAVKTTPGGRYFITASHPDYSPGSVDVRGGSIEIEIRLKGGFHIFGSVFDDQKELVPGINIALKALDGTNIGPFVTDRNGEYKTNPVRPGWILVSAEKPSGDDAPDLDFTDEKKWVQVEDQDMEVNFGPSIDHVTWTGTFYGWDREPVAKGNIRVWNGNKEQSIEFRRETESTVTRRCSCDDSGRFELRKLGIDTYKVDLYFEGEDRIGIEGGLDEVTFTQPGLNERDIYLRKTEISGVVIDGETREPVKGSRYSVSAYMIEGDRYYSTDLDSKSRFRFRGLAPGEYWLKATGHQDAPKQYGKVILKENQIIDGIEIVMPIKGKLAVKVTGLHKLENSDLVLKIFAPDGEHKWTIGPGYLSQDSTWSIFTNQEVGSWVLVLEDASVGRLERPFDIFRDKTTKVEADATDFVKE